jgi:ParB family transcriptional regulator, chromosome partitioning protein
LIEEIPLDQIAENPFNPRIQYEPEEVQRLAFSLRRNGQLSPIKVRRSQDRIELVYGHRRVRAARQLGWRTIKAEVETTMSDESMLTQSLAENIDRENLSDFERARSFSRLESEFGWSHEKIGEAIGYSRSHVCNFVRMSEIFTASELNEDPILLADLRQISEHHARFLLRIEDKEVRKNALKLVVREKVSVRDLQRMFQKLRGWFDPSDRRTAEQAIHLFAPTSTPNIFESEPTGKKSSRDEKAILDILDAEFNPTKVGGFESFRRMHADGSGFSLFSSDPGFDRLLIEVEAAQREKMWFQSSAKKERHISHLKNVRIQFVSKVAIATLTVEADNFSKRDSIRGTVVLIKKSGKWKILHEHWSEIRKSQLGKANTNAIH